MVLITRWCGIKARAAMTALREMFLGHMVSQDDDVSYPVNSADSTFYENWLWGYLKGFDTVQNLQQLTTKKRNCSHF